MLLYRCEPLSAWLTERGCWCLRKRATREAEQPIGRSQDPMRLRPALGALPCAGCPGVRALAGLPGTPAPRAL